jgi:hypothetical protein
MSARPASEIRGQTVQWMVTATGALSQPPASLQGIGPVTEAWVRRFLGPHASFTTKPVLDLEGQAPVDGYEIPRRHGQAVHLMTPADIFPFASTLAGASRSTTPSPTSTVPTGPATSHGRREATGWAGAPPPMG